MASLLDVSDLLCSPAGNDNGVGRGVKTADVKNPARKKKMLCLVFWVDEKKTSIEPLSAVDENNRSEGKTCMVKWKGPGKKAYLARILKISGKLTTLD
jgi:hypothetical protein